MTRTCHALLALIAAIAHARLGALKRLWTAIELQIDGQDLAARLPLGRPRDAAGSRVLMVAPCWLFARHG